MTVNDFIVKAQAGLHFCVMFCPDSELKSVYIKLFAAGHKGKLTYKESLDFGKQPRQIGPAPVYIIEDWEQGLKKPSAKYMDTKFPVLLVYATRKSPSQAVQEAYGDNIIIIPEVTGAQVTTNLKKLNLPVSIIDFVKEKTDTAQEAILTGRSIVSLAQDLSISVEECFQSYFEKWLVGRNLGEEPTEFLNSILNKHYGEVFSYLYAQRGNELFVFASVLNWLEDMIKFCSCTGNNYWEEAGLVAARYKPFQVAGVKRIPFVQLINLYEYGLKAMQSIKINEADPASALEVFVCRIIQKLM